MQGYTIETTKEGILLSRENVENLKILCKKGLCRADITYPKRSRQIEFYDEHVLKWLIDGKIISDGSQSPFDDRKMRYDSSSISKGILELGFGHSNYLEFKEPFELAEIPGMIDSLKKLGKKRYNDKYALFSRAPGVHAVPITSEGNVILGVREIKGEEGLYQGKVNGLAGHLNFRQNPSKVNLEEDILREAREELGIDEKDVKKLIFCGLVSNPEVGDSDLDFIFLMFTLLSQNYFLNGEYKKKAEDNEHKELIKIDKFSELEQFLKTKRFKDGRNFDLIYHADATLRNIKKEEIAN